MNVWFQLFLSRYGFQSISVSDADFPDGMKGVSVREMLDIYLHTGCFFLLFRPKMTKCQKISKLFLPEKRLGKKKVKVPEVFLPYRRNSSNTLTFLV